MKKKKVQGSKFKVQSSAGFTLIELLVVIAIIAILATMLMVNFIGVRQRARDGQREANLQQLQAALELYRSDNDAYPQTLPTCGSAFTSTDGNTTYMQKIPCDPLSTSTNVISYTYTATPSDCTTDCSGYSLVACLENASDSKADTSKDPSCDTASFTVTNP